MHLSGQTPNFADSQSLYNACRSADREQQSAAYQALGSYLFAFAKELIFDQSDGEELAADCVQEALIRIHLHLAECNPPAFLGWTRTITRNLVFDELKRRNKVVIAALSEEGDNDTDVCAVTLHSHQALVTPTPETQVVAQVAHEQLLQVLDTAPLSDHARTVLIDFYFYTKTHDEIAAAESIRLGRTLTPANTMVTLSRTLTKLRHYPPLLQFLQTQRI